MLTSDAKMLYSVDIADFFRYINRFDRDITASVICPIFVFGICDDYRTVLICWNSMESRMPFKGDVPNDALKTQHLDCIDRV